MSKSSLLFKIGREVKRLRLARGWPQAELARRSQISRSYVQKIESRNPADMSLAVLARLATGFEMKCYELVRNASRHR